MRLTIIDYKAGNIASVVKAFEHLGAETLVTNDANNIATAEALVLPGVGHFSATRALDPLRASILSRIQSAVPFLGICVGMQWLYQGSAESPDTPGIGLLRGTVERFPKSVKSPHVGWNTVTHTANPSRLLPTSDESFAYFTHSYRCPVTPDTTGITEHGGTFAASIELANIFGVQFHVEKSGDTGLAILRNFVNIAAAHAH